MKRKNKEKEIVSKMAKIFYAHIFDLDTKTLLKVYTDIYKELLKRQDFNKIEDTKIMYEIYKQKLIEEGVYNV